jgi:GT2 family glycosyltransferase
MRIIFCLPGRSFSGKFLQSWTVLMDKCLRNGIDIFFSQKYTSNVYYVRSLCLGADVMRGPRQKPFDGKVQYDYIMWIDSDVIFEPDQFFKLLSHKKDIVGGLYLMEGGQQFAVVKDWDEEFFKSHSSFKFLTPNDLPINKQLMEVSYSGFGFLLMKHGVFETIDYPWFEPQHFKFGDSMSDFASEDVSFCLKAKKYGYKIHIDPTIVVGHEKTQILHCNPYSTINFK